MIIGGGVEGCEFAALYSGLGAQVDLVEMMPTILPTEDEELSRQMTREFTKQKVQLHTDNTVEKVDTDQG